MNPVVWSCGMGLNSVALAVGLVEHAESYDLAMFADTGGEKPETYAYQAILAEYLQLHGLPPVMTVWRKRANQTRETLEQEMLRLGTLPSLAYGWKTCSQKHKIEPQEQVLNNWQPAIEAWKHGQTVTKLIGYDVGETRRVKEYDCEKYTIRYPLREWGWDREACEAAIVRAGLPLPPKSACFFCPSTQKDELIQLAVQHPDLVRRAVLMEKNAEDGNTLVKGLGRKWAWHEFLKATANQQDLYADAPQIPCDCFDGGE